ncbi:hypothetical protein E4U22_000756 [Claviceps purpurea]|nr:hypothetical protein E4U22_000756 [Claviceps purpurea]
MLTAEISDAQGEARHGLSSTHLTIQPISQSSPRGRSKSSSSSSLALVQTSSRSTRAANYLIRSFLSKRFWEAHRAQGEDLSHSQLIGPQSAPAQDKASDVTHA